ncbi:MAG TPA: hypothetical protein VNY08_11365 [Bradyrhizobium sp.]|jgi:hypothetical protein|nr:hypothetical protein [Bradyrhizobium sp.]
MAINNLNPGDLYFANMFNDVEFHHDNRPSPSVAAANAEIAGLVIAQPPADINNEMIGKVFDDATTRLVGGVDASNAVAIVADLKTVQADMAAISAGDGEGTLTELHYDVMEHQLNQEIAAVNQALNGTNPFAARTVNDIHRDILDIFLGDPNLVAEKGASWTPLPQLTTPSTPFADDAKQTTFVSNFITDSNTLADRALAGETGDQLIHDLQHFITQAEKFVMADAQTSTVFNARFENEIGAEGTAGTAAGSLIEGLQKHDMGEITAAATQLITNASDFAGNNQQANGATYDAVVAAAKGSTAPFIDLKGGGDHHDNHDHQSAQVQTASADVDHVAHSSPTFEHLWHHA